jgi:hypothetical protein
MSLNNNVKIGVKYFYTSLIRFNKFFTSYQYSPCNKMFFFFFLFSFWAQGFIQVSSLKKSSSLEWVYDFKRVKLINSIPSIQHPSNFIHLVIISNFHLEKLYLENNFHFFPCTSSWLICQIGWTSQKRSYKLYFKCLIRNVDILSATRMCPKWA